ncbi:MAG: flagellar hook-length control protein FliK [Rubrivivax sp.]|nr:flagellar hook-length control protein FliK [Rubrivivax sp.]
MSARSAAGDAGAAGAIDTAALGLRAAGGTAKRETAAAAAAFAAGHAASATGADRGTGTFAAALEAAGAAGAGGAGSASIASGLTGITGMVAASGTTAAGSTTPTAPLREAGIAAPPGSEAFARDIGAQVSLFARDGVQHARLHLNPQELGPVFVQIQLDGQAAHVQFTADLPPTREALEQALPTLAGQLSEAGLTLAGGGVFERTPQGNGERSAGDAAGGRAGGGAGAAAGHDAAGTAAQAGAAAGAWSRPRGLVDLVA